jgi:putative transposase
MSRSGNVWDNPARKSLFSSLKTERTARKTYRTRDEAKADVFDYIERFYNAKRRHSTIGYRGPMEFEIQAYYLSRVSPKTGADHLPVFSSKLAYDRDTVPILFLGDRTVDDCGKAI